MQLYICHTYLIPHWMPAEEPFYFPRLSSFECIPSPCILKPPPHSWPLSGACAEGWPLLSAHTATVSAQTNLTHLSQRTNHYGDTSFGHLQMWRFWTKNTTKTKNSYEWHFFACTDYQQFLLSCAAVNIFHREPIGSLQRYAFRVASLTLQKLLCAQNFCINSCSQEMT